MKLLIPFYATSIPVPKELEHQDPYENSTDANSSGKNPAAANSDDHSFRGTVHRVGKVMPAWAWNLLAFVTIPIWGPILLSAIGVVFGTLCAIFWNSAVAVFYVVALSSRSRRSCKRTCDTVVAPPASLIIIGGGILLIALGTLLSIPTIWLWSLVPKFFRYTFAGMRRAFSGGKGATV
jgi:hypothetical protein